MLSYRSKLCAIAFAVAILPGAAFAQGVPQPADQNSCGLQMPVLGGDELAFTQPADTGQHDRGMVNYSAVRGSIVHMDGPLALVQLDGELAGNNMAVVQLPDQCMTGAFSAGTNILAIGTPTDQGILQAVEVTQAA